MNSQTYAEKARLLNPIDDDFLKKMAEDVLFCQEVHQKRVRYHASCITANMTDTGSEFKDILDLCIIYISKSDFLGEGKTVYHIDRIIRETGTIVENGFQEIYVNAANKDGSNTSKLMTIFTESNAYDDVLFPVTSKRKRYFKEDRKGVAEMCAIMDEIREEGRLEGKLELLEELGRIPEEMRQKLLLEINLEKLKKWHKTEEKAESIEQFLSNI